MLRTIYLDVGSRIGILLCIEFNLVITTMEISSKLDTSRPKVYWTNTNIANKTPCYDPFVSCEVTSWSSMGATFVIQRRWLVCHIFVYLRKWHRFNLDPYLGSSFVNVPPLLLSQYHEWNQILIPKVEPYEQKLWFTYGVGQAWSYHSTSPRSVAGKINYGPNELKVSIFMYKYLNTNDRTSMLLDLTITESDNIYLISTTIYWLFSYRFILLDRKDKLWSIVFHCLGAIDSL